MSRPHPTIPPPAGSPAAESTFVRVRRDAAAPPSVGAPSLLPPSAELRGTAVGALEQKLAMARILLQSLPAREQQATLLKVAILRRDETLLDGLLKGLVSGAPGLRRATLPPSKPPV
jgi:hypothetical protein